MGVRHTAAPDKLDHTVLYSGAPPPRPQDWGSQDVRIQSGNQASDIPYRTGTGQRVGREVVWREVVWFPIKMTQDTTNDNYRIAGVELANS